MPGPTKRKIKDEIENFQFVEASELNNHDERLLFILHEIRREIAKAKTRFVLFCSVDLPSFEHEIRTKLEDSGYSAEYYSGDYRTEPYIRIEW